MGSTILVLGLWMASPWPASELVVEETPARSDAIVILSGDADLSRAKWAAVLYQAGLAPVILTTGAGFGGDDARWEAERLVELGVPRTRIRMETCSTSTLQNVEFLIPLLMRQGMHRVLVVTSPFHARRARRDAERIWSPLGIRFRVSPAVLEAWRSRGWWVHRHERSLVFSEWGKWTRDVLFGIP